MHQASATNTAKTYPLAVRNAGLVLLHQYIPMLFERLALSGGRHLPAANAGRAAQALQFLATGQHEARDESLVLNKLLCGLSPAAAAPDADPFSVQEQDLMKGLLQAVIGHWPAVGAMSVEGFRGNWVVRDGLLREQEERWELTVEKRAYDVLLARSPFSFSIIKYDWMPKPVHVNWPY